MDGFFIEYRDPLFGIIVFLLIIVAISLATYFWKSYNVKKKDDSIKKFTKRFEHNGLDEDCKWVLEEGKSPVKPLMFLGSLYEKSGEFEKAIKIYLTLLDSIKDQKLKSEIMEHLGRSYYHAGFLHRSRDIFLEILKNFPRNRSVLEDLLLVYENLNDYKKAMVILEPLQELGMDINRNNLYFKAKNLINDPSLVVAKKSQILQEFVKEDTKITRLLLEFLREHDNVQFWKESKGIEIRKYLDIFWNLKKNEIDFQKALSCDAICDILEAKGFIEQGVESEIFELTAIKSLRKFGIESGDLNFEFVCNDCKNVFPLYFDRCPNCHSLLEIEPIPILVKSKSEENNSLL